MPKIVLSASRRTDIPAFYMEWFMAGIKTGFFQVENPFSGQVQRVSCRPEHVHTIMFWSKDFGLFLREGHGPRLQQMGYNLFFNFTINSEDPVLEPHIPPLSERLKQLEALASLAPPEAITWRFDPVCFYRTGQGSIQNNLKDFKAIAEAAEANSVTHCTTSFVDMYTKIKRRLKNISGFSFEDVGLKKRSPCSWKWSKLSPKRGLRWQPVAKKISSQNYPAIQRSSRVPAFHMNES